MSVRLDDEVQRALRTLEAIGNESVGSDPQVDPRRRGCGPAPGAALRSEVEALEADEEDRREMQEVASLMESLRAEG